MDKVALVTGAARRVGAQIVRSLHAQGYRVVIHYFRSPADAEALAAECNRRREQSALTIAGDLSETTTPELIIEAVAARWGRLDVLVNNAAIFAATPLETVTAAGWDRLMNTNLRAPYLMSKAALALLRANAGCIVNLTDIYGDRPKALHAVYSASKAGLINLTKGLARDLAPTVRVNGVSPGPILWVDDDDRRERAEIMAKTPLQRTGEPTDIASAICYLAAAPYVTGQIIAVDGGRSIFM